MRQLFLFLSVLLLGLSWAAAQSTSSSPNAGSTSAGQTTQSASGTNETTVEGCLSGSNGNYTLTDKNGTSYQLTGDTAKLSEHIGHEVKITGSMNAATGSASSGGSSMGNSGTHMLEVSSLKHISKTCKSTTGTSKY